MGRCHRIHLRRSAQRFDKTSAFARIHPASLRIVSRTHQHSGRRKGSNVCKPAHRRKEDHASHHGRVRGRVEEVAQEWEEDVAWQVDSQTDPHHGQVRKLSLRWADLGITADGKTRNEVSWPRTDA